MSTSSNNLPSPKAAVVKKQKKLVKEEFQLTSPEHKKPLKRKLKADRLKEEQEKLNEERLMREQEDRLKEEKLKEAEKVRREKKAKLKGEEKKMEVDGYTTDEEELCQPNHRPFPSLYEINDVAYTTRIQVKDFVMQIVSSKYF